MLTADNSERERMIEKFMPYARSVAWQTTLSLRLPVEKKVAVQAAYVGLCEAANRFSFDKHDPALGDLDAHFKSFAYLRIRGAVIDECRKMSFVSRRGVAAGVEAHIDSLDVEDSPALQLADVMGDGDLVIDFADALRVLTPREYKITMGFAIGMKGRELADQFGITESRVSQIAAEARNKLEKELVA